MFLHRPLFFLGAALLCAAPLLAQQPADGDESNLPSSQRNRLRQQQQQQPPPAIPGTALPSNPTAAPAPGVPGQRNVVPAPNFNPTFNANAARNPAAAPAIPGTGGAPGPLMGDDMTRVYYPNAPIAEILDHYALLTGKRMLPDNTVQGSINITDNKPMPKSEAIRFIEVALNLNGFTLVEAGGNIVKVLGLGKPIRNEGVPIFSDLSDLPDSEQVVSFLVRPRYLDPQETAGALQQYVPIGNRVAFNALEKAGALIITDTASSVRRLVNLLSQIDLPSAPVVEKFIRLERADVTKAVEFLNSVFDLKSSGSGSGGSGSSTPAVAPVSNPTVAGVRRPIRRLGEDNQIPGGDGVAAPFSAGGLQTLSGDSLIQGRITLTPDVRTNRVHIVTSPLNLPLVERLLQEYDADTPFASPVKRPLRFVSAKDVLPILVQALSEPGAEGGGNSGTSGGTGTTSINNNSTRSDSGNLFQNLSGSRGTSGNSTLGGSGGSSNIGSEGLETQPVDTTPTIATVGNTKLIADQRSNTIIVLGGQEARDKVFQILDRLDERAPQVVIRTVIGELSLGNNNELGFNYLLRTSRGSVVSQFNQGFFGGTNNATPGTTPTSGTSSVLNTFTDLATGVGSNFSGVGGIISIGRSFEIILSALESTNRFKTISRPMIFTSNNKKAIIASGQEIAVPTSQVGTSNGSVNGSVGTYTNVDYKSVTLQLEVVPLINSEKEVTLDILQKIDSLVAGSSTTVNGTQVPTIATRYLKSTVSAPNGSTIVLGGLITQNEAKTRGNIPYLSRIPVLGNLFRSRTDSGDRSELIVLMHPEVVNTPGALVQTRANEERRTYLGGGLEQQLLPMTVKKAIAVKPTPTPRAIRASYAK